MVQRVIYTDLDKSGVESILDDLGFTKVGKSLKLKFHPNIRNYFEEDHLAVELTETVHERYSTRILFLDYHRIVKGGKGESEKFCNIGRALYVRLVDALDSKTMVPMIG